MHMGARRRMVLLGATGTVGLQTLALIEKARPGGLEAVLLSAHRSTASLQELASRHPAARACLTSDPPQRAHLLAFLRGGEYEVCLNAVVGSAGLPYSEAVLEAGRTLALANKESLVCAGDYLTALARSTGARIVPVDSEHAALHQCLEGRRSADVRRVFLTASGGALRDLPLTELAQATPEQALAHPNWDMGPRITVDSATMMNKAFEIIEAVHLFGLQPGQVEVLLHRESVVHGMVEFLDGSLLAQMGPPDMAFPIHRALHWPECAPAPLQGFRAELWRSLHFAAPDAERWPALALGLEAARRGGNAGAVLNGADDVAVEAFLARRIGFQDIVRLCAEALAAAPPAAVRGMNDALAADRWAREFVTSRLAPSPGLRR